MANGLIQFDYNGQVRAWRDQLNGEIYDEIFEALANIYEYAFPKMLGLGQYAPYCKMVIQKTGDTKTYAFGIIDNGIGIEPQYWDKFCKMVYVHLNTNGIVGKYGEGIKKSGLAISSDGIFIVTKNPNEPQERTVYQYFDENIQFQFDDAVVPKWMTSISYNITQSGTGVWVLIDESKIVPDAEIFRFVQEKFSIAMRTQKLQIEYGSFPIPIINYGEKSKDEYKGKTIFTKDVLCPICSSMHTMTVEITVYKDISLDLKGWLRYFVNGIEIYRTRPHGMGSNAFEIDITTLPHLRTAIRTSKKDLLNTFKTTFLSPIESFLIQKYQTTNAITKLDKIADEIIKKLMKDGGKKPKEKHCPKCGTIMLLKKGKYVCPNCGYTKLVSKRKDYEYLWYCPKCDDYFFSDKKENVNCPKCGTKAIFFKVYKQNPKKPFDIKFEAMGKKDFAVMVEPILFINTEHPFYPILSGKRGSINILGAYASLVFSFWQDKDAKENRDMQKFKEVELRQLTEDNMKLNKGSTDEP